MLRDSMGAITHKKERILRASRVPHLEECTSSVNLSTLTPIGPESRAINDLVNYQVALDLLEDSQHPGHLPSRSLLWPLD